ncbi:MAG: preprotein translocase subunit SecE [Acidobacteriaceae bacterium]
MAKAMTVSGSAEETPKWKAGPEHFIDFLKDVRNETKKLVTPSRAEVQTTTFVVIVTVFMFAAYFWLVDNVIGRAIEAVLKHLTTR